MNRNKLHFRLIFCAIVLALSLKVNSLKAEPNWRQTKSVDVFRIHSEVNLFFYRRTLGDLKTLRADIQKTVGLNISNSPVDVFLFSSQNSYRKYVGIRHPKAVNRRALYVKGPAGARVYVFRQSELSTDLKHECTHALLHSTLPYVPLWLDEGLAEYFEVPPKYRYSGHPHTKTTKSFVAKGWKPNLKQLENKERFEQMTADDYRHAWVWTHYLLHHSQNSKSLLKSYLQEIKDLKLPGPLSERIEQSLPNAPQSARNHLLNVRR